MSQEIKITDETQELEITFVNSPPDVLADSYPVLGLISAIRENILFPLITQVLFEHLDPPIGLVTHRLTITLSDSRTAKYDFSQMDPAKYELSIANGFWNEVEVLGPLPIRAAIVALHNFHHVTLAKWEPI